MTSPARQIARAASIVMLAFIASRILGLVREMVIGARFGTSAEYDAYLAAFRLPDLLYLLIAGGALASAFIPAFTGYLTAGDRLGAWRLTSAVANIVTLILAAAAALAAIFAPALVATVIAPGFDPATQALTVSLMRVMLIAPVIFGASGVIMGALNAQQHFLLPALAPIAYNLAIIAGAAFLSPFLGAAGLAIGVVAGAVGHLLIQVPGLVRFGARYFPVFDVRDPGVVNVARLMGPRVLGLAVVQLNFLINTNLASRLGEGAVSALNYAWLLMLLPLGVFAQSIATAAFPTFAAQAARNEIDPMRHTLSGALRATLFLSLPAAVGLIVLRTPLVQLLFERGEFTPESTQAVAYTMQFFALGLVAHSLLEIVTRGFYAMHDTRTPVIVGVAAMLLNLALSLLLIGPLAEGGLALANSIATTVEALVLVWLIRGRLSGIEGRRVWGALARSGLASAAMGLALLGLLQMPMSSALAVCAAGIAVGMIVYAGAALLLRADELRSVRQLVQRRGQALHDT
ncbi:MAG TPA: murein biosynthesis integral membrane protein MurJ [Anaerolineae bacterium]|nr:murein biosynthesis integral membrane protein MurJ [Anaerolineae bacterium]